MDEIRTTPPEPAEATAQPAAMVAAKKTYNRLGLALFVMMLSTVLLQLLLGGLAQLLAHFTGWAPSGSVWFSWAATFLPLYGVGIPLALLLLRSVPAQRPQDTALGGRFWLYLLMCFPMLYAGNILGILLSQLFSKGQAANPLEAFAFSTSPLKVVFLVILAPLLEEFIFRRQLIDRCAPFGEKTAVLFSALVFALAHGNLFQFFYAFGLGLLFGYVYVRTGRLRYSVAMHITVNFIGSVLAPFIMSTLDLELLNQIGQTGQVDPSQLSTLLPGLLVFGLYALLLLGLSITGLVVLLVRWSRRVFLPAPQQVPQGQGWHMVFTNLWVIILLVFCAAFFVLNLV